jgi:hypothetical protein
MMADMQSQIDQQQAQLDGMQGQIDATQQALPPESQEQLAQEPTAGSPVPMPQENPDLAAAPSPLAEGGMDPLAGSSMPPEVPEEEEGMSDQVTSFEDLLSI